MNSAIQKAMTSIDENVKAMLAAQKEASKSLPSLLNTAEQLDCCNKVWIEETALCEFEDLQELLQFKLMQNMETKLQAMYKACSILETHAKQIHRTNVSVMTAYRESSADASVSAASSADVMWPSLARRLEWLGELDDDAHWLSCEKQAAVQRVNFNEISTIEHLNNIWLKDHGLKDKLKDIMLNLQFFMEEKF